MAIPSMQVVVTGSSRGLGLALADHFLQLGDRVLVTSRTTSTVNEAVQSLKEKHPSGVVHGHTCDVSRLGDSFSKFLQTALHLGLLSIKSSHRRSCFVTKQTSDWHPQRPAYFIRPGSFSCFGLIFDA